MNVFACFCNGFLQSTVIYTSVAIKPFQSIMFYNVSNPQTLEHTLLPVFSSIFLCSNAAGQLKHIYKKSFHHIVFHSVFTMFPVNNTVIHTYTFFAIKSVQNISYCSVFNALASKTFQNIAIYNVFSFLAVFPLLEA